MSRHSAAEPQASDRALDQRIIDAFISEQEKPLRELVACGLSSEELHERAHQLGLTREFIRACRLAGARPSMRACMKCDTSFVSAGPHNRLCRGCNRRG